MRLILAILCCFATFSLAAETIGNIEYHLPDPQKWKLVPTAAAKGSEGMNLVYIPADSTKEKATEFFGIYMDDQASGPLEQSALEQIIKTQFPKKDVKVSLLERTANSTLYEWSVSEGGQEKTHGWTRAFSGPDETAIIMFQTEQIKNIDTLRPIWVKALKDAKVLEPATAK